VTAYLLGVLEVLIVFFCVALKLILYRQTFICGQKAVKQKYRKNNVTQAACSRSNASGYTLL